MDQAVWCATASRARPLERGIEPRGFGEPRQQSLALDRDLADAADQQIAIFGDVAAQTLLDRQPRQIAFCHRAEAALLPGIDGDHKMAGKALHHMVGHPVGEAFFLPVSSTNLTLPTNREV